MSHDGLSAAGGTLNILKAHMETQTQYQRGAGITHPLEMLACVCLASL